MRGFSSYCISFVGAKLRIPRLPCKKKRVFHVILPPSPRRIVKVFYIARPGAGILHPSRLTSAGGRHAATRLSPTPPQCGQESVSLQPIRCGYDTFLTSQNSVPLLQASRRAARADFSAVFFKNSYIVDIQAYTTTQLSVRNKNGGKTWLAALQNSLSCSLTLTILACKEVKVRGQNSQSQSLTLTILQRKTV